MGKISIFISYSQSEEKYKALVHQLSDILIEDNFEVMIDKNGLEENSNLNQFMEKSIEESKVVLVICTPSYKKKADDRDGGVGYETDILSAHKFRKTEKIIIPVLLDRDSSKSIPSYLSSEIYYNLSDDFEAIQFKEEFNKLKKYIFSSVSCSFDGSNYIKINDSFYESLNDIGMFNAGNSKIALKDIFVYPQFRCVGTNAEYCKKEADELINQVKEGGVFIISGKDQFGKSAISKSLFLDIFDGHLTPLLLNPDLEYKASRDIFPQLLESQYLFFKYDESQKSKSILIIDDFHKLKKSKQDALIKDFNNYHSVILIVDDIFELDLKNREKVQTLNRFTISEFNATKRDELIKKWVELNKPELHSNDFIAMVDQNTSIINNTMGSAIRKGLMPSTPFFILSIMSTYESFNINMNRDITSQGHCYQALIFNNLIKSGIETIQIDAYLNLLSEFANFVYKKNKFEVSHTEIGDFFKKYREDYNLPENNPEAEEKIILKLLKSKILQKNSFGMYKFYYPYVYYYFLGKYISDNYKECESLVSHLINNLHQDKNAYICIFLIHHNKDEKISDEIQLNAMCLFDEFKPASLLIEDIAFFNTRDNPLIEKSIPKVENYEKEREQMLLRADYLEEESSNEEDGFYEDNINEQDIPEYERDLRKSVHTVQVIGTVVRNRAGSFKKETIETLIEEGISINLRIIQSFLDVFCDEKKTNEVIDTLVNESIENMNNKAEENEDKNLSTQNVRRMIEDILSFLGFGLIISILRNSITSIGSKEVLENVNVVCDRMDTPASMIIKHGINMWYGKNVDIKSIDKHINSKDFNEVSKKILIYFIMDYCANHKIHRSDIDRLVSVLNIDKKHFLLE